MCAIDQILVAEEADGSRKCLLYRVLKYQIPVDLEPWGFGAEQVQDPLLYGIVDVGGAKEDKGINRMSGCTCPHMTAAELNRWIFCMRPLARETDD